jgi:hypothetical protein
MTYFSSHMSSIYVCVSMNKWQLQHTCIWHCDCPHSSCIMNLEFGKAVVVSTWVFVFMGSMIICIKKREEKKKIFELHLVTSTWQKMMKYAICKDDFDLLFAPNSFCLKTLVQWNTGSDVVITISHAF